jgi:hypothetical protein
MTNFRNKAEAIKAVTSRGYVQIGLGQCGDGAYGTRIYFEMPGSAKNQYGCSMDLAQVDKVCGRWVATVNYKPI